MLTALVAVDTHRKLGPGLRRDNGSLIFGGSTSGNVAIRRRVLQFLPVVSVQARLQISRALQLFPESQLDRCRTFFAGLVLALLIACGGGAGGPSSVATPPPVTNTAADITLLFMGNSHTSVNNIPGMVAVMVRAGKPGKTVAAIEAPSWMHLEERAGDATSLALLQSRRWNYVILQAQNYSLSGQTLYPTTGAEMLVRLSRQAGALPVLFPEWPRMGTAETQIIIDKYVSIAMKEPACVPPIPQAFDLARARFPAITLHNPDGNHSAPAGAFLASLILYATITGAPPSGLPALAITDVAADVQEKLRGVATEMVQTIAPRLWCPADRPE